MPSELKNTEKPILPERKDNLVNDNIEDPNYWRSFGELYNDPEFLKAKNEESEESISELGIGTLSKVSRRKFLALLSASAALAAAGCNNYRDKGEIIPYSKKPEEVFPGIPNYYASTCTGCNNACGILIKTREGRPIKVDGNPDHPVSKGKICGKGQASILNLYDPDRIREPLYSSDRAGDISKFTPVSWKDADNKITSALRSSSGKEIAVVTGSIISPTAKKVFDEFRTAYPNAKVYSYEVINEQSRSSAWNKSYGNTSLPVIDWNKAKIILSLESDFLGSEGNYVEQVRAFADNRDIHNGRFNRLYSIEGGFTVTGANADYRLRLRPDRMEEFIMCLINEFSNKKKLANYSDASVTSSLTKYSLSDFAKKNNLNREVIELLISDLEKNQGSSIVIAGNKLSEQAHTGVNLLNEVLGNTKLYSAGSSMEVEALSTSADIENLVSDMQNGRIAAVIHYNTDPVFNFISSYNYKDALAKVPLVITFEQLASDTAVISNYIFPVNDQFESWGDFKTRTGFYSLQQPVISPLYNSRQKEAVLLTWISQKDYNENVYHQYLMDNWEKNIYPSFNSKETFRNFWLSALHDGVVLTKEPKRTEASFKKEALNTEITPSSNAYVILLQDSYSFAADGRFANNGWLQELPHPISKMVWDNYAAISVQTSAELGVKNNDLLEIKSSNTSVNVPVFVQPGLADNVIEIALGYGRTNAGQIGSKVGVNVNRLITKTVTPRILTGASVSKADGKYELVSTQEHHPLDESPLLKDIAKKRKIIREGTYNEYKKDPKFLQNEAEGAENLNDFPSINKEHKYEGVKWGMVIDLNKCTGCNDCIVACNVENNVPIVGKDQVRVNREMIWLRIDRYYSGTPDAPEVSLQPMLCQHCDFAPCENVCPVAATTHSPDGLNGMAYNRCVGTRYCSNNCPYKVRRFNFFNHRDRVRDGYFLKEPINLMYNPEVTVRSRGVMEKCTFCLQRIMDERQKAIQEKRGVIGSNVKTACQDACPANAISFGDIHDKESEVAKLREHNLSYLVLEELKVRPNVTYLAKLRNVEEKIEHK